MTRVITAGLMLGLFLAAGCIPTLHPLYKPMDVVYRPELLGEWREPGDAAGGNSWTFSRGEGNTYRLEIETDGKTGVFNAHVVRINDKLFLDIQPDKTAIEGTHDVFRGYLIAAHTFFHIHRLDEQLVMSNMDPNWVKEYLHEHPEALKHAKMPDGFPLITASTAELQAFALKHLETAGAYNEPGKMVKQK